MSVNDFRALISSFGIEITETVSAYIEHTLRSGRQLDLVPNWFHQMYEGKMMDDHLLLGALSAMDLPLSTVVPTPLTNEKILGLMQNFDNAIAKEVISKIKPLMIDTEGQLIIPVAHDQHWATIIVKDKKIWWGDSLNTQPFQGVQINIVNAVKYLMEMMFKHHVFHIQYHVNSSSRVVNYITDVCKYSTQDDGYSCGFYVATIIGKFCKSIGNLPLFDNVPLKSETKVNSGKISENIRKACIINYFNMIKECGETMGRRKTKVNDLDVTLYINKRMRYI